MATKSSSIPVTSGLMMPPTSATSTFAPLSSHSPSTSNDLQHNPDLLASSDSPNFPPSASFDLNNVLPPESHLMVTTVPSAFQRLTPATDLGIAAKDNGSLKLSSHKDTDALDPPLVNRTIYANNVTLDLLPQSPSPVLITDSDVAIARPSQQEPNTEHTGDYLPHPSHFPYDIV
ncbi:hypothetical protein H4582DRAFT_3029 [Lactarius indigo]|nr:hypothetical protein H4582DRAFT_3029 [Lactarius indigo]